MSEYYPLPSEESLAALELAVSDNNIAVTGGTRVPDIPNALIRFMVEEDVHAEQSKRFPALVEVSSAFDWEVIIAAERHARQELAAAAELRAEATAAAEAELSMLETSVILGVELAPGIEDEIRASAESQRRTISEDHLLPAEQLYGEKAAFMAQAEAVYMRAGRDWLIPNLAEIPREIAPGRYPPEEETVAPTEPGSSAEIPSLADLPLNEEDRQMLDVILGAVSPEEKFRHATVDAGLANLGIFNKRPQQQYAFARLTKKLIDAGILEGHGNKGGRYYILKSVVAHPDDAESQIPDLDSAAAIVSETSVAEQPAGTPEVAEEKPKFLCIKEIRDNQGGYLVIEGTYDEIFRKRLRIKDRRLAKLAEVWITWLSENPFSPASTQLTHSSGIRVRFAQSEEPKDAKLYRFSPKDANFPVPEQYKGKRLIFTVVDGSRIALQRLMDHREMDRGLFKRG